MTQVETAIRAWVQPKRRKGRRRKRERPWRPQRYGERVLIFDVETSADHAQRLLFAFFRLYERDRLVREGIIAAEALRHEEKAVIAEYAARHRLPIYSPELFIEQVFFPEVYDLGTLCVGFNLPFDLPRVATSAGCGRGANRRKFRIRLSRRVAIHDLHIESASGHAAFIGFVPKRRVYARERPFFKGRFLDLSTLARAMTGQAHTLEANCNLFNTHTRKMKFDAFGQVTRRALTYGRQDVRVTWALYRKLREEYQTHPFATFENELHKPEGCIYMGQVYSGASVAKAYLRLLGFRPLLEAQPNFNPKYLGYGAAAYFGGRSEVRVRRRDAPVIVADYTSMYPLIMINQDIQGLLSGELDLEPLSAAEVETLLEQFAPKRLYDPTIWPHLNCLVLLEPNGAVLPARFQPPADPEHVPARRRSRKTKSYTIAVTPLRTQEPRWYTLAEVIAAMVLGLCKPKIVKGYRVISRGSLPLRSVPFRGEVSLSTDKPVLRTLVEERQRVKNDKTKKHLERGLKVTANSIYGIFAEMNVSPHDLKKAIPGHVYSDNDYDCANVHDERPGAFSNPIIASLITGGARLMLALFEHEVHGVGGTFAFCDTDCLAIVSGPRCPKDIPSLSRQQVEGIQRKLDALNPYGNVEHVLKFEYDDVRCFAISAKRYVLYRIRPGRRIEIVKASESGLGAIIGRTQKETTRKLARRVWLAILMKELKGVSASQRRRAKPLIEFNVPLRRKFPIGHPSILQRLQRYNQGRRYEDQVKPGGFVQTVTPALIVGSNEILPIAPFEQDLSKSKRLAWIDFKHPGTALRLDWSGSGHADAIPVMRMDEYVEQYRRHPEIKAADAEGNPAGPEAMGMLRRLELQSVRLTRIGKEVDRLDQDEGASLEGNGPVEFKRESLAGDIALLATLPQESTARSIGISERRWRDIVKGNAKPHRATTEHIASFAAQYRLSSSGSANA
jgi:hypothetical protein